MVVTVAVVYRIAISCGDEGRSGGCVANDNQLWEWWLQWRLCTELRSAVGMMDAVAVVVYRMTIICGDDGYSGGCVPNGNQLWG
jgi:hypothetical protein